VFTYTYNKEEEEEEEGGGGGGGGGGGKEELHVSERIYEEAVTMLYSS
jgi:hypothetical protein